MKIKRKSQMKKMIISHRYFFPSILAFYYILIWVICNIFEFPKLE